MLPAALATQRFGRSHSGVIAASLPEIDGEIQMFQPPGIAASERQAGELIVRAAANPVAWTSGKRRVQIGRGILRAAERRSSRPPFQEPQCALSGHDGHLGDGFGRRRLSQRSLGQQKLARLDRHGAGVQPE